MGTGSIVEQYFEVVSGTCYWLFNLICK